MANLKLVNKIAEYTIPIGIKHDYEKEIEGWIEKKWLQKKNLEMYGLHCKPAVRMSKGSRALGLQVGIENK